MHPEQMPLYYATEKRQLEDFLHKRLQRYNMNNHLQYNRISKCNSHVYTLVHWFQFSSTITKK